MRYRKVPHLFFVLPYGHAALHAAGLLYKSGLLPLLSQLSAILQRNLTFPLFVLHVRFRLSSLKHSQISVQAHICLCFETGLIHKNRGHPTTKFRCPLNYVQLKILHPTVYPPFRSHLSCCRIFQPYSFYFRRSFLPATSLY